ncbi:type IV secretion system protein [Runella sp. MFBS21]|uniref:type IV secretion system protein n=1 Tax=Runella sp. MFBS21 TaxID=3034018 RepID=UPI0023F9A903|nr:type IV secretion system protein [Runella sp. MFBS21]MDF7821863.1 type IV secretion system protein [Runella sp. MFBS21]
MESLITIINELYEKQLPMATTMAETIEKYVRAFSAIGALIYIFGRVIVQIANNQDIDVFPLLRPFVIFLLINSSSLICNAIDSFGTVVRNQVNSGNLQIADRVATLNQKIQEKIDKKWDEIRTNPELYKDAFGSSKANDSEIMGIETDFVVDFKISFAKAEESIKFQILSVVQTILLALMYIAESCLLLISVSYRLVLRMGFPITIALTIFPGFTQAFANWAGRYVNFAILPAVAAMYSRISFALVETYLSYYNPEEAVQGMGAEMQQPEYLGMAFISLLFLSLIGYIQVPSMANMLVTVGGVGQLLQAPNRAVTGVGNATQTASRNIQNYMNERLNRNKK